MGGYEHWGRRLPNCRQHGPIPRMRIPGSPYRPVRGAVLNPAGIPGIPDPRYHRRSVLPEVRPAVARTAGGTGALGAVYNPV